MSNRLAQTTDRVQPVDVRRQRIQRERPADLNQVGDQREQRRQQQDRHEDPGNGFDGQHEQFADAVRHACVAAQDRLVQIDQAGQSFRRKHLACDHAPQQHDRPRQFLAAGNLPVIAGLLPPPRCCRFSFGIAIPRHALPHHTQKVPGPFFRSNTCHWQLVCPCGSVPPPVTKGQRRTRDASGLPQTTRSSGFSSCRDRMILAQHFRAQTAKALLCVAVSRS